ncbi:unknown [Eggerthella sp. CAG:298]|nr:unknown [Eggerthella sp. CAG:298]
MLSDVARDRVFRLELLDHIRCLVCSDMRGPVLEPNIMRHFCQGIEIVNGFNFFHLYHAIIQSTWGYFVRVTLALLVCFILFPRALTMANEKSIPQSA